MAWCDDDDRCATEHPEDAAPDRRAVVRAAAAGLVLAAGGLFVPVWREEAAARPDWSSGSHLGGRHGKNRRGRDENRQRKRGDNKRRTRESTRRARGIGPHPIRFTVVAGALPKSLFVELYALDNSPTFAPLKMGRYLESKTLASNHTVVFQSNDTDCLLWIDHRVFIEAYNPGLGWPELSLGIGGEPLDGGVWEPRTTVVDGKRVDVGEGARIGDEGLIYAAWRLDDRDSNYKEFSVEIF
jgi:hypothetical protein